MGSSRQQKKAPAKQQYPDSQIAAAIAAVLAGEIVVANVVEAIKGLVLLVVAPLRLPEGDEDSVVRVGADLATRGAADDSADAGGVPGDQGGAVEVSGADAAPREDNEGGGGEPGFDVGSLQSVLRSARRDGFIFRAYYVINAVRRIARDIKGGTPVGEAVASEEAKFRGHLEANRQRLSGANAQVAMALAYGTTRFIWWHSGALDYRPTHKAAEGKVYDVLDPPVSTGGLPATLRNCGCFGTPAPPDAPVTLT